RSRHTSFAPDWSSDVCSSDLEASAELRFPIRGPLGGVAFVDAGQVDLDPWGWKLGELTYSLGAGLRFSTPLGPIRLDIAHPLNRSEERRVGKGGSSAACAGRR